MYSSLCCRRHEYALENAFLAHKVLAFALSRLKGVASEATKKTIAQVQ